MISFADKDERLRLNIFIITLFVAQGIIFYFLNIGILKNINDKYIIQNTSIVGKIQELNPQLVRDIIPIITRDDSSYFDIGREVLKGYSYDTELNIKENPLIKDIYTKVNTNLLIIIFMTLILSLFGICLITNPIFKQIKYLTQRAEDIVEGNFNNKDRLYRYEGSLNKFISKFYMMENRIENSIQLLHDEKINLKNIINDISHQLKTPLTALLMYNDILNDHINIEESDVDNFLKLSKEQLERMDWLVKTLLKYARLESNVVEYHKEYFSLVNTVEESLNPLKVKAEEKNQELVFYACEDVLYYHDRKWVAEAISNIIKNAMEHTDYNGKIEVSLEETPLSITVAVKDNGEGIEKSELKKIFNRFHKGENSINPTSIGIGLCLSRSIIAANNGDITVESKIGVGSTFYITFLKTFSNYSNIET